MVEGDEVCDDGVNDGSYGGCLADCTDLGPHCGDGIEQATEACDDGDEVNGNGCNVDCLVSGSELWTQILDGGGFAQAVAVDDEDGALVAISGGLLQNIDANGALGWDATYTIPGITASLSARSVDFDAAEDWIVSGDGNTASQGYNVWWKPFSAAGSPGTATTYDNPVHSSDFSGRARFNDSGQLFVAGSPDRSDVGQGYDVWLRKLDTDGSEMWTQTFDGGDDDDANAVAVGADGYVIVAGSTEVAGEGRNAWLRKYSPEGSVEWTRTSAGAGASPDWISGVAVGPDLSIAVIGNESDDIWIRKYDQDGNVEWTDVHDGPGNGECVPAQLCLVYDSGNDVAFDSAGAVIAVGAQSTSDEIGFDNWVRKYSGAGVEMWTAVESPNANAYQSVFGVAITSTDAIIVAGLWDETADGGTSHPWVKAYTP
jgi:cysteine-rich repeat protein